jgi:hypothetical protein
MHLDWASISPSVDFTDATTTFLTDDPGNWPPSFVISGFTYDRFGQSPDSISGPAWDHIARCAWLDRQAGYDADLTNRPPAYSASTGTPTEQRPS